MKSKKRKENFAEKRMKRQARMGNPGYESNYAKKQKYLRSNGGWGFDYIDKPWK